MMVDGLPMDQPASIPPDTRRQPGHDFSMRLFAASSDGVCLNRIRGKDRRLLHGATFLTGKRHPFADNSTPQIVHRFHGDFLECQPAACGASCRLRKRGRVSAQYGGAPLRNGTAPARVDRLTQLQQAVLLCGAEPIPPIHSHKRRHPGFGSRAAPVSSKAPDDRKAFADQPRR